jgi:hypothetical protein
MFAFLLACAPRQRQIRIHKRTGNRGGKRGKAARLEQRKQRGGGRVERSKNLKIGQSAGNQQKKKFF